MLIEALFTGVLSVAAPQLPTEVDHAAAPIVLCDDEEHGKSGQQGDTAGKKKGDKKDAPKPEEPKPS